MNEWPVFLWLNQFSSLRISHKIDLVAVAPAAELAFLWLIQLKIWPNSAEAELHITNRKSTAAALMLQERWKAEVSVIFETLKHGESFWKKRASDIITVIITLISVAWVPALSLFYSYIGLSVLHFAFFLCETSIQFLKN